MDSLESLQARLSRLQFIALAVGAVALVASVIVGFLAPVRFFQSYLFAFLFCLGMGLGCLAIGMLHHLTGGRWGVAIRRFLESGAGTMPLLAVMFLPLLFALPEVFEWARPGAADDIVLKSKIAYLNVPFFLVRAAIYFAVWLLFSLLVNYWSMRRDTRHELHLTRRLQLLSGPGLLLYGLTITFASFDWGMSLEPHWFSTMYGVLFMIGQVVGAMALVICVAVLVHGYHPFSDRIRIQHFHDLGNLLMAFVMLWAYIAFSQYLIIWSANLPEETPWYIHRTQFGWQYLALILIVFHFFVPFMLLMARQSKRNPRILLLIAAGLIVMRLIDLFWLIMPAFYRDGLSIHLLDFLLPVALGGLWLAMFCWQLRSRAAVPVLVEAAH